MDNHHGGGPAATGSLEGQRESSPPGYAVSYWGRTTSPYRSNCRNSGCLRLSSRKTPLRSMSRPQSALGSSAGNTRQRLPRRVPVGQASRYHNHVVWSARTHVEAQRRQPGQFRVRTSFPECPLANFRQRASCVSYGDLTELDERHLVRFVHQP